MIKTASWFTPLPTDHAMIGISRGVPRRQAAGFRVFRKLQPGQWFNSVGVVEYVERYTKEVLSTLDPHAVVAHLHSLAVGRTPVLVCFEKADGSHFCHRALAARWLAEALGEPVPEFGHEHLPQHLHPLLPRIGQAKMLLTE